MNSIKARLLISIPSRSHIEIAQDELDGLQELGYTCEGFDYAAKDGISSTIGRLWVVFHHAILLVLKAYRFSPNVIYFNSRLEEIACTRDFLTIFLFRIFYWKKVSFMIKSHGSDVEILEQRTFWMRKIILPFLKKQINAWLFLSSEEQNKVVENGFMDASRIFVTKNIVRAGQFQKAENFRSSHHIGEESSVLLFAGRFIREKGVFEVLNAFIQVSARYDVVLILVGDGPEKEPMKRAIEQAKLSDRVIFTGFIPEQEVISYYANSDILIFPTYFPEGFPMALFNAVAAGMSVVTTATRAATDYLTSPSNCLWVKPRDSKSVEEGVSTLLNSPALRLRMNKENLEKGKQFSRERVCAALSLTIEAVLISNGRLS